MCSDGPPLHEYDSQLAVTHWLNSSARRHSTNIKPYGPRNSKKRQHVTAVDGLMTIQLINKLVMKLL